MSLPFALVFLVSFSALAQNLDSIEVRAEKDVERFTFSDTSKISKEEIDSQTIGQVTNLLENETSLVRAQDGGLGGRTSYFMRGTESRHIGFTIDGLKMNDPSGVSRVFDAAYFTTSLLQSVEVHKGPQAVLFGSDAIGGLIELKTRKGSDNPETKLTINGGSFGTVESTLATDWGNKDHRGTVTLTRFRTDGISRLNKKRYDATERDSTDITQVSSSSAHAWTSRIQTDLLFSYLHSSAEMDGYDINFDPMDTREDKYKTDQYIAQQKTSFEIANNRAITLRNGLSRHDRKVVDATSTTPYAGNVIQNELTHQFETSSFSLLSGVSTEHEDMKDSSVDKNFDLHSLFVQGAYRISNLKLHAGGRADEHTRYGSFLTGAAGASFEKNHHRIFTQYSQGYKAPSLMQLYGPWGGNKELTPEINHSLQLGWKLEKETFFSGVTLFQNRLSNLIGYDFTDGYFNGERLVTEGVELAAGTEYKKFKLAGSYTHQKFKEASQDVLRRPYNILAGKLSYHPAEDLEFNLKGRYFSSRKDSGNTKINSYEVFDLGAKKTWTRNEVGIEIKNILDREYEEIYGYSVMPRSIFGHFSHKF